MTRDTTTASLIVVKTQELIEFNGNGDLEDGINSLSRLHLIIIVDPIVFVRSSYSMAQFESQMRRELWKWATHKKQLVSN